MGVPELGRSEDPSLVQARLGKLNIDLVKASTGHFDAATITKFSWCNKALSVVSGLSQCCNLVELDLTGNNLVSFAGLSSLPALRKLVLTSNRIDTISGIMGVPNLEHLLLQANNIITIENLNLSHLASLPNLHSLYLRNVDKSQANGVCRRPNYKRQVLAVLPNLSNLDGERCPSKCRYMDVIDEAEESALVVDRAKPSFVFPAPQPWFSSEDFVVIEVEHSEHSLALSQRLAALDMQVVCLERALQETRGTLTRLEA